MNAPGLVVVGASWGGVLTLERLLGALPPGFPVPVAVVQHRAEGQPDHLPCVLQRVTRLHVKDASDKEAPRAGTVYLAPAGYHLLVEREGFVLSVDPRVSHARPSIDVLFESAAEAWQEQLIAVLLTGSGRDGAAGLATVQRLGGITIVEDPETAIRPEMPRAALKDLQPTHVVPLERMPALLSRLCRLPAS